jgi:hypothetical protein
MKNSTIVMFGIVAAVAMLSAAVVLPIQQASADGDTVFKFTQKAKSSAKDDSLSFNIQSICQNFGGGGSCRLQ